MRRYIAYTIVFACRLGLTVGVNRAEAADNTAVIQVQLLEIQKRLEALEAGQQKILEGQAKLGEEHTQLRYFVHRR